ncbi:MAG: amidohydrolase family protein [Chitinophagaceae bacterium]|nr:amidohydrolase family protein [Chitinophagaceae bacterium]
MTCAHQRARQNRLGRFETATQAAAAGGITTIIDMPLNASPVTTTVNAFNQKLDATKNKLHINVGFYGGLVPGNINDLEALIKSGVLGIKCFLTHSGIDEFPNVGEKELNQAMPLIAKHNIPLLAHCEIESEVTCDFSKFPNNYQQYLASRPKSWENDAVDLMIKLCRKFNCSTHIVHVSSAEALEKITKAKKKVYNSPPKPVRITFFLMQKIFLMQIACTNVRRPSVKKKITFYYNKH